ncbi:hypothetical protein R3P38DRAFT_3581143 [Favolaschia claudopus]|uniref:Uncharacterized protein n=1 Tax=Favolaschia claudopus TaxID=2862362 RepID=A0AAW0AKH3_9AGAR
MLLAESLPSLSWDDGWNASREWRRFQSGVMATLCIACVLIPLYRPSLPSLHLRAQYTPTRRYLPTAGFPSRPRIPALQCRDSGRPCMRVGTLPPILAFYPSGYNDLYAQHIEGAVLEKPLATVMKRMGMMGTWRRVGFGRKYEKGITTGCGTITTYILLLLAGTTGMTLRVIPSPRTLEEDEVYDGEFDRFRRFQSTKIPSPRAASSSLRLCISLSPCAFPVYRAAALRSPTPFSALTSSTIPEQCCYNFSSPLAHAIHSISVPLLRCTHFRAPRMHTHGIPARPLVIILIFRPPTPGSITLVRVWRGGTNLSKGYPPRLRLLASSLLNPPPPPTRDVSFPHTALARRFALIDVERVMRRVF